MAKNFPPDEMVMAVGTWGTDADEDTGITFHSTNTVKFPSGAVGTEIETPLRAHQEKIPLETCVAARMSAVSSGETFDIRVAWYDKSQSIISTSTIFSGAEATAGVWRVHRDVTTPPATTFFYKVQVRKSGTLTYQLNIAAIGAYPVKRSFSAYMSTDQTDLTTSASSLIEFDTETYDHGNVFTTTAGLHRFDLDAGATSFTWNQINSVWMFEARVQITNLDVSKLAYISFFKNGVEYTRGSRVFAGVTNSTLGLNITAQIPIVGTDYIDVRVYHNHGSNRTAVSGQVSSRFSGFEINQPMIMG